MKIVPRELPEIITARYSKTFRTTRKIQRKIMDAHVYLHTHAALSYNKNALQPPLSRLIDPLPNERGSTVPPDTHKCVFLREASLGASSPLCFFFFRCCSIVHLVRYILYTPYIAAHVYSTNKLDIILFQWESYCARTKKGCCYRIQVGMPKISSLLRDASYIYMKFYATLHFLLRRARRRREPERQRERSV